VLASTAAELLALLPFTPDAMRVVEFPAQTACRPPGNERLG
jgi:hypothetical protein